MQSPSIKSLKRAIDIAEQIQTLEGELASILAATGGGGGIPSPFKKTRKKRSKMSRAGREKIAAAQRARWAKVNAAKKS